MNNTGFFDPLWGQGLSCLADDRKGNYSGMLMWVRRNIRGMCRSRDTSCKGVPMHILTLALNVRHTTNKRKSSKKREKEPVNIIAHTRTRAWHVQMMLSEYATAPIKQMRISLFFGVMPPNLAPNAWNDFETVPLSVCGHCVQVNSTRFMFSHHHLMHHGLGKTVV